MAEHSTIEWTDATWNPITGCSVVSPGCTNCYAMGLAGTRLKHHPSRAGLTVDTRAGPVWNGQVRLNEAWLTQPLEWKRPRRIFVCAHGDLFAEGVPDAWIDKVFAVMALASQHTFQVLTKRPARMRAYLTRPAGNGQQDVRNHLAWNATSGVMNRWAPGWGSEGINWPHRSRAIQACTIWPLPNVWLGVSAEDQRRADERVPDLLATPAAVRFVSAEPLLGPLDFTRFEVPAGLDRVGRVITHPKRVNALTGAAGHHASPTMFYPNSHRVVHLDWIIVGGESGPSARPMHPAWARAIRDQCAEAGVAFHFKQHGGWLHETQGAFYPPASWFDQDGKPTGPGWHFWTEGDRGGDASVRVGKKAAGRLLDGVEHNGMPEVRP